MSAGKILVVDDDRNLLELIKMRLEAADYEVTALWREQEAVKAAKAKVFDLAVLDLHLAEKDGISLMEELHLVLPEMPVIILTAYGSIESAVEATKKGAYNYLTKPFEHRDLLFQIKKALEHRDLLSEIERLKGLLSERYDFPNIIAKSEKMQGVLDLISQIAPSDSTICIYGETGVGKGLIAKTVHLASLRKDKPFVTVDCAALPEALIENELFGYVKGAFTGAVHAKIGLLSRANGGTLFLNEIGAIPLAVQAKLVGALHERTFYQIGADKLTEVDVRLITATSRDLEELVRRGLFREDLFYRIHVIPVRLPPLRERKEDIPSLAAHFLKIIGGRMSKEAKGFTPEAMRKLMLHAWPGNVRELEGAIEHALALADADLIGDDVIPPAKMAVSPEILRPLAEAQEAYEKDYLLHVLKISAGSVSKAAALAGKSEADFKELVKKHALKASDFTRNS